MSIETDLLALQTSNSALNNSIVLIADNLVTKIPSTEKGVANGVATLDATGKVPSTQLPSYVDDVLEFTNLASFPATGETGKIYVAMDTNKTYRWGGSSYTAIASGSVDSVAGKTGVVTLVKGDVGLGNVDNTADSAKVVLSATRLATARSINGVSFDGTTDITLPVSGGSDLPETLTTLTTSQTSFIVSNKLGIVNPALGFDTYLLLKHPTINTYYEYVKVVAVNDTTVEISRGALGTSALEFPIGTKVDVRLNTEGLFNYINSYQKTYELRTNTAVIDNFSKAYILNSGVNSVTITGTPPTGLTIVNIIIPANATVTFPANVTILTDISPKGSQYLYQLNCINNNGVYINYSLTDGGVI